MTNYVHPINYSILLTLASAQAQMKFELSGKVKEPIIQVEYNADGSLLGSISDKDLRIWRDTGIKPAELIRIKPKFDDENYLSSLTWEGVGNISLISA